MQEWRTIGEKITGWMQKQADDAGADGLVVGLSGGLDSAVTAILCKKAFPEKSLALIMPCGSRQDMADAKEFAKRIGIDCREVALDRVHEEMLAAIKESGDRIAEGNLKARLRMCALYFFANARNYLVVGTGTRSELGLGYFTKYGDGAADLLPLAGLLKTEIKELAKTLDVPENIIAKKPSAGLWKGQTDEKELGMSYAQIDYALERIAAGKESEIDAEVLEKIRKRISASEHKRGLPRQFSLR